MRLLNEHRSLWLLSFFSIVLLISTLPFTLDLGFLSLVAFIPFFYALRCVKSSRTALLLGLFVGTFYMAGVLAPLISLNAWWWLDTSGFVWTFRYYLFGLFLLLLAFVGQGIATGIFAYLFHKYFDHTLWRILLFALIWTILEKAREFLLVGSWGYVGYALHDNIFLLQGASIVGIYGLSFLVMLINLLFFSSFFQKIQEKQYIQNKKAFVLLFFVLISAHLYGFLQIEKRNEALLAKKETNIALIHSHMTTEEGTSLAGYKIHRNLLIEAYEGGAEMIVLPENVFPFLIVNEESGLPRGYDNTFTTIHAVWNELTILSEKYPDSSLILGTHTHGKLGEHNAVLVFQDGSVVDLYHKRFLIPISEKTPRSLRRFHIQPLVEGSEHGPVIASGHTVSALICSEVVQPTALSKSDFVAVVSNDGVFQTNQAAVYNHVVAKFRAIESNTYLGRAVKDGISSIISPTGYVVEISNSIGKSEVIFGTIHLDN